MQENTQITKRTDLNYLIYIVNKIKIPTKALVVFYRTFKLVLGVTFKTQTPKGQLFGIALCLDSVS